MIDLAINLGTVAVGAVAWFYIGIAIRKGDFK